jgi:hypothetical protein
VVSYDDDNNPIYKEEREALTDEEKEFYDMRGWKYFSPAEDVQHLLLCTSEGRSYINPKERFVHSARCNDGQMQLLNVAAQNNYQNFQWFTNALNNGSHVYLPYSTLLKTAKVIKFIPSKSLS